MRYDPQLYDSDTRSFLSEEVEFYEKLVADLRPKSILELGVGSGRVFARIVDLVDVAVGIDLSRAMLDVCRKRCGDRAHVWLVKGNISHFNLDQAFDFIYIPFNTFLHLSRPEDQHSCLAAIESHLTPHGHLVLDMMDLDKMDINASIGVVYWDYSSQLPNGQTVERFRVTTRWDPFKQISRKVFGYKIQDGKKNTVTKRVSGNMSLFTADQIQDLLCDHGLEIVQRWSNYRFGFEDADAKMILLIKRSL